MVYAVGCNYVLNGGCWAFQPSYYFISSTQYFHNINSDFEINLHELLSILYLRVYKPHFFWQEFTLQNWGAAYTRN
jgi:hypothetical protein